VKDPGTPGQCPGGAGTCAKMAAMHAKEELPFNQEFRQEGLLGTVFTGIGNTFPEIHTARGLSDCSNRSVGIDMKCLNYADILIDAPRICHPKTSSFERSTAGNLSRSLPLNLYVLIAANTFFNLKKSWINRKDSRSAIGSQTQLGTGPFRRCVPFSFAPWRMQAVQECYGSCP